MCGNKDLRPYHPERRELKPEAQAKEQLRFPSLALQASIIRATAGTAFLVRMILALHAVSGGDDEEAHRNRHG